MYILFNLILYVYYLYIIQFFNIYVRRHKYKLDTTRYYNIE